MNPKFLSNKVSIDSHDIILVNGKIYEFYEDGSGKVIRSQDITDISIKENNAKVNKGKSCSSKSYSKTFEIHASHKINSLTVTTEEKINSDLADLEYLKNKLQILISELNKKCIILKNKKIEITGTDLHDGKEVNSSISDEFSLSMPILSPQLGRNKCDNSLEKLNAITTSATAKLLDGSVCNASTMPTLSPYYTTQSVFLSKKINKKLLSKSKSSLVLPSHLRPHVSIVRLSKSLLAKYSVSELPKTSKRKLDKGFPVTKSSKKTNAGVNSSSEFINSPRKNKNVTKVKSKAKNVKLKNNVPKKKSLSSAKNHSTKKKYTSKPKKKLVMSSSLWINRESDSSSSSPASKKLVEGDPSFSEETCKASIKSSSPSSEVDLCKSPVKDNEDLISSNNEVDSGECDNNTRCKSQKNITLSTLTSSATGFLTPTMSLSDSDSQYFTPTKNDSDLSDF